MRAVFIFVGLMISAMSVFSQGINFEKGSWKEVVAKAKAEKKLIYMDVYAEWCGPCKMMARDVFPNERAGEKYNKLFINYKIDAEKGEGRDVAKQYGVSSYPTNLYINPNDESVVYRISGACGVDEFLNRADIAQLDFTDPMSWEEYQAQLKKNPKDYAFLLKYMGKANRLGMDNDAGIDAYVAHHLSLPVHDSNIYFLVMNTQTFDNKGYAILKANQERMDAMIQDPRQRFAEREKGFWLQGTFKKAVAVNDLNVMNAVKPVLYKYNKIDSLGKWFTVEQLFYTTMNDHKQLLKSHQGAVKYYAGFNEKKRAAMDALMLEENVAVIKSQPNNLKLNEEQMASTIATQKQNIAFSHAFTNNAIIANMTAVKYVLEHQNKNKKVLKEANNWIDNSLKLTDKTQANYESMIQMKAMILYYQGDKSKAESTLDLLVADLLANKKNAQASQELLAKIKEGKL